MLLLLLRALLAVCVCVCPCATAQHQPFAPLPIYALKHPHHCILSPVLSSQVQTVSFLSHLRSRGVNGPFLIIGPLSTLRNWSGEVKRWCPSMPVLEYHGSGAKARTALRAQHMPSGEVVWEGPA